MEEFRLETFQMVGNSMVDVATVVLSVLISWFLLFYEKVKKNH